VQPKPQPKSPTTPLRPTSGQSQQQKPFLVNENPKYHFVDLPKMPETQLVMAIPRHIWLRLQSYIPAYEAVTLAGRFGADPGDYEWELLTNPEGLHWWRRSADGYESLFGLALVVWRGEWVELYGLVEVDETSPFWPEIIPEEVSNALPQRAKLLSRQEGRNEDEILTQLYKDYFKSKGVITIDQPGQPACRRGSIREAERFRDALKGLIQRCMQSHLPSEVK